MYPDRPAADSTSDASRPDILRTQRQEREARMGASTRIDPPRERLSLGQLLERSYQVVVNIHEELNILENQLGPVLQSVPPTSTRRRTVPRFKTSSAFTDQLAQQIDGMTTAVRRLRILRERLAL
jgi:hypothetical protein